MRDPASRDERVALEEHVIPIVEERVRVARRTVETGRVRVTVRTRHAQVEVDEPLLERRAHVERVAVDRFVDEVPAVRTRGGVTIVPVVEEVLVKRLVLREELHISAVGQERRHRETVDLRVQEPTIERLDPTEP